MKLPLLSSVLLLVPLVAVTGSPVITDLPIADRIKLIYKNRFLIVEASNAEEISFFNIKPGNSAILLRNSTKESGFLGPIVDFRSDIDKQAEGFVVETRPGEKGVSPDEFCMLKSECFQNLKFLCEGPIALRSLNAEEKEQIERLKMKHANDQSLGPFRIVHDVQKTGRSPTIRVEAAKLENFGWNVKKGLHGETFLTAAAGDPNRPNPDEPFNRILAITTKVKTSSFVIEGLPKDKQVSCKSTDLPYEVKFCEGAVRIRKMRDGE